jgi:DNA-binding GntR family transcriptional regulator
MEGSQRHHREMVVSIERGDVTALQEVIRAHVLDGTERALATLQLVGGVL